MSLKNDNTPVDFEGKTYKDSLPDVLDNLLNPLTAFYDLVNGHVFESSPETQNICLTLKPLLDRLQGDLDKLGEIISESIGEIEIESPCRGSSVRFKGKVFRRGDYIRAILEPKELASGPAIEPGKGHPHRCPRGGAA